MSRWDQNVVFILSIFDRTSQSVFLTSRLAMAPHLSLSWEEAVKAEQGKRSYRRSTALNVGCHHLGPYLSDSNQAL